MPSWWGKSSSKEVKRKEKRESIIDTIQHKLKSASEEKSNDKSRGSRRHCSDTISEKGSRSLVPSRSPSPSTRVPLPKFCRKSSCSATPTARGEPTDAEGDIATASVSSDSSIDSDDQSVSHFLSPPLPSDCENGNRATIHSSFSVVHKDQPPIIIQKSTRASSKPAPQLCNNQLLSNSPKRAALRLQNLQIAPPGGLWSAPDSSMSSPSKSPMRTFGPEQDLNSGFCTGKPYPDIASGQCSSPGSGHNSVGVDLSVQIFWSQSRCSPECFLITSPGMTSPGLSSRIHSGAVTPLHPRAGGAATESPTRRPDDAKQQTHRLPLPPITITNSCPFSPTYSATTTPSAPRSPGSAENLTSPGSRWKRGKLLGRGTFGHVYLGFNKYVASGIPDTYLYIFYFWTWTYDHCIVDIRISYA